MKYLMIVAAFGVLATPANAKCWHEVGNWVNAPIESCEWNNKGQATSNGNADSHSPAPKVPDVIVVTTTTSNT